MKIYGKRFFQYVFLEREARSSRRRGKNTATSYSSAFIALSETVINLQAKHRYFLIFSDRNWNFDESLMCGGRQGQTCCIHRSALQTHHYHYEYANINLASVSSTLRWARWVSCSFIKWCKVKNVHKQKIFLWPVHYNYNFLLFTNSLICSICPVSISVEAQYSPIGLESFCCVAWVYGIFLLHLFPVCAARLCICSTFVHFRRFSVHASICHVDLHPCLRSRVANCP